MYETTLRKVGGSVMLAVPPALLDMLRLSARSKVGIVVEGDRLIIKSASRPRHTLDQLLAQCDASAPRDPQDGTWLEDKPVGTELI